MDKIEKYDGSKNIISWLEKIKEFCAINRIEEKRMVIEGLEGEALDFVRETNSEVMSLEEIQSLLMKRFEKTTKFISSDDSNFLREFLNKRTVGSGEEMEWLIKMGERILISGMMDQNGVIEVIVRRSPPELQFSFLSISKHFVTWSKWREFKMRAEEVSFEYYKKKSNKRSKINKKYCVIHKECTHLTQECTVLKKIVESDIKKINDVNRKKKIYKEDIEKG